jgi:uncharacterized protein (DUF302 family)
MKRVIFSFLFVVGSVFASDLFVYRVDNSKANITPQDIEKEFVNNGFKISDNRDMNLPYKTQFGQTDFKIYNLFTFFAPKESQELLKLDNNFGVFIPMSASIWQKKGDSYLYISVLNSEAQAKVLGINSNDTLKSIEKLVQKSIKDSMKNGEEVKLPYSPIAPQGELVTSFEVESDDDEAIDTKDEIEMLIEDGLKPKGFVMAGFTDFNYIMTNDGEIESDFVFYDTYSICKLKVIYSVAKTRPEAGAFAPCSMAVYKAKGSESIVLAYPSVYNWMSSLAIDDKSAIDELLKAQKDMESILKSATE